MLFGNNGDSFKAHRFTANNLIVIQQMYAGNWAVSILRIVRVKEKCGLRSLELPSRSFHVVAHVLPIGRWGKWNPFSAFIRC